MVSRRMAPLLRKIRGGSTAAVMALGALTSLLPCGLLYLGLALALSTQSLAGGALTMFAFGLGTLPALSLAALFTGPIGRLRAKPWGRYVIAAFVGSLGLLAVGMHSVDALSPAWLHKLPGMHSAMSIVEPAAVEQVSEEPPPCH